MNQKKQKTKKSKTDIKKLFSFLYNLAGKKTRKSFSTAMYYLLESYESKGFISMEERNMFKNMVKFNDKKIYDIMTPRLDVIAIRHDCNLEEIKKIITNNEHTRIPIYKENFDEIIGFIHSKDLVKFLCGHSEDFSISKILRKILFVPGSMKLSDVMFRMRMARVHIAMVLDEFGGIDGIVTIENIMEEIVGNIEDEHDLPSDNLFFRVKKIKENLFHFGGRVELEKIESIFGDKIKQIDKEIETIGGLVLSIFKRVPKINEEIEKNGFNIKIIDADNRMVKLVEVEKLDPNKINN